uniref:50S ribosomal protein L40e n=1 Tax=uncultured korarchaeote TaxID=161241 RepID=A0A1L2JK90_9CREN|nr:ribosomal protein L40E [uncultured korarchaeote]
MPITDPLKKRIAWEALLNYKICRKCGSKNPINAVRCRRCKSKNLRKKHTKLARR